MNFDMFAVCTASYRGLNVYINHWGLGHANANGATQISIAMATAGLGYKQICLLVGSGRHVKCPTCQASLPGLLGRHRGRPLLCLGSSA